MGESVCIVCIRVCMCVGECVYIGMHVYMVMHIYMHICVCVYKRVCVYTGMPTCVRGGYICKYVYTQTYTVSHRCTCVDVCVYMCMFVCVSGKCFSNLNMYSKYPEILLKSRFWFGMLGEGPRLCVSNTVWGSAVPAGLTAAVWVEGVEIEIQEHDHHIQRMSLQ